MLLPEPQTLFASRYQLGRVLGAGGFATVFLARDNQLHRDVAIKVLRPEGSGYAPGTEARFTREVRIIANLRDRHTVTMFEFGHSPDGLLFMVFEYVEGHDLAELIRGAASLDQRTTTRIARQVLMSLREAHNAGLLHRDIKPENIRLYEYLGDPLCVKVLDFGIARLARPGEDSITRTGAVVGTPLYMSPEQILGAELSPSSDIYSLALVMYEMLVGRGSLDEVNRPSEQLKRLTYRKAIELPAEVPADNVFRRVLHRMLAIDAAERFATADDVLRELELDESDEFAEPSEGYALDATQGFVTPIATTAPEPFPALIPRVAPTDLVVAQAPKEGVWQLAAFLASLVLMFGVVAFVMTNRKDSTPPPAPVFQLPAQPPAPVFPVRSSAAPREEPVKTTTGKVGCGGDMPRVGVYHRSWLSPDLLRYRWMNFVPKSYDPKKKHRVLLLFHTNQQTPEEFFKLSGLEEIAEQNSLVVMGIPGGGEAGDGAWASGDKLGELDIAMKRMGEALCLDPSRVFAVGVGAGGRFVERMPCDHPVSGIAVIGHRGAPKMERSCTPERPAPYILFQGIHDGYNPVDGSEGCGLYPKLSLSQQEQMWRKKNGCSRGSKKYGKKGASFCRRWTCGESPFVSCRLDSGRVFFAREVVFMQGKNCAGEPADYPVAERIWDFFEAHGVDVPADP